MGTKTELLSDPNWNKTKLWQNYCFTEAWQLLRNFLDVPYDIFSWSTLLYVLLSTNLSCKNICDNQSSSRHSIRNDDF